ncbi:MULTISPECIES: glycosyltransferase family 4 protein [unclassified Microbacterium]|uniref:glycosyltransferase family 4 protein n=1 Tax=unclassified Microbacterium TaxID=2609290 RepID=UPI0012FB84CA|nr:glycosyltransferase family 4 protein [Microbacterium sp. MAH-37]MVQ42627.1 glycosyltransferase [Microbacterium sp. MAH-37]
MTPLRILHLVISDRFAGVEQFVLRLAQQQAEAGHEVHVAGGDPARMRAPLAASGVSFTPVTTRRAALSAARAARVDVLATHMTDADAAGAIALRRDAQTALVSTRHFARARRRIGPLSVDALLGRIDAELSISDVVAGAIGVPSTVVHTGVPDAAPAAFERRVLMVQRLEREKHTEVGIRAFLQSGLGTSGWTLQIIGDGAERRALETLASPRAVRFLGYRDDVPAELSRGGLFLATCPVEGLGIAALEAMSHGLPVIAADAAGYSEVMAGLDERALFRPDSVEDAAGALRIFAAGRRRRRLHGAAGRKRQQQHFSLASQLDGTDAVYRDALTRRRG